MEESWKEVPGYNGAYLASTHGRLKSVKRFGCRNDFILKQFLDINGYYRCVLTKNGKSYRHKTHTIIAIAFLDHYQCGHKLVIDHVNGDRADNRLENIRVVTNRFNCAEGFSKKDGTRTSNYAGVSLSPSKKRWVSRIQINGKTKHLGTFDTEIEASRTYQNELLKLNQ